MSTHQFHRQLARVYDNAHLYGDAQLFDDADRFFNQGERPIGTQEERLI